VLNRKLLSTAVIGNCVVAALSLALSGWNAAGAGSATRNTARFAIVFFLAGLAAPGLNNWIRSFPEPYALIHAFVAAQMIHFGCVALLHTHFAPGRFHLSVGQVVITIVGFSLVAITGASAIPRPGQRLYGVVHSSALYAIFLILAADYSEHPVKRLRLMLIPVVSAVLLRHLPRWNERPAPRGIVPG
jgi:hypothetical protein